MASFTNSNDTTSEIVGRALVSAESIASELRRRLASEIARLGVYASTETILSLARDVLDRFEPILAQRIADADLAGLIAGMRRVVAHMPRRAREAFGARRWDTGRFDRDPPNIIRGPPEWFGEPEASFPKIEEAVDYLLSKQIVTRPEFNRMADDAKANAFLITGDLTTETIEGVRNALAENIAKGADFRAFRREVGARLETSGIGAGRLETIFRNNVQSAFTVGQERLLADPIVDELFPYQEYFATHDARSRAEHRQLETLGIQNTGIYRRDDPFWNYFSTPWAFNCRCTTNVLTLEAAARKGIREAQEWIRTGVKPPLESRLPYIPFRPDPKFVGPRRFVA